MNSPTLSLASRWSKKIAALTASLIFLAVIGFFIYTRMSLDSDQLMDVCEILEKQGYKVFSEMNAAVEAVVQKV